MLDAAVIMMQQYSAAAALSVQVPRNDGTETASPTSPPANASSSQSTENISNGAAHANPTTTFTATVKTTENITTTSVSGEAQPMGQDEELRRRRLQKFQQPQEQ